MSEKSFFEAVKELEAKYSLLIKGETNPEQEAELRVELIDLLSTLKANAIGDQEENKEFLLLLEKTREALLEWDPYGPWFRQNKILVDSIYEIIVKAKNVVLLKSGDFSIDESIRLKRELAAVRDELNDLRKLMMDLVKSGAIKQPRQSPGETTVQSMVAETTKVPSDTPATSKEEDQSSLLPPPEEIIKKEDFREELTALENLIESEDEIVLTKIPPKDEASKELTMSTPEVEIEKKVEEEEEPPTPIFEAAAAVKKLSETPSLESHPSRVLDQMKSIISQAEEDTRKQIEKIKEEHLENDLAPPFVAEDQLPVKETVEAAETAETVEMAEGIEEKTLVATSEPGVLESKIEKSETAETDTSGTDPYMQLLTLEAEKYRLEKEIEKLETEFQEGLTKKEDFEEGSQAINEALATVREQIDSLRKELTHDNYY